MKTLNAQRAVDLMMDKDTPYTVKSDLSHILTNHADNAVKFLEMLYSVVDDDSPIGHVIIEVTGGVAEVTEKPADIDVQIIDHDNMEDEV